MSCIDSLRNDNLTPLFLAAYNGHIQIVRLLLALGASDNHMAHANATNNHCIFDRNNSYVSAVQWTCKGGDYPDIIKLFLKDTDQAAEQNTDEAREVENRQSDDEVLGDDQEEQMRNPFPEYAIRNNSHHAILQAAWYGRPRVMQMLIDRDVCWQGLHLGSLTTLKIAADLGHVDVVRVLVTTDRFQDEKVRQQFLDFNDTNHWLLENGRGGHPAILDAFNNENYQAIVELLVEAGARVEVKDNKDVNTPLSLACSKGNMALVKYLLKKGATLIDQSLQIACKHGHTEIVDFLLLSGVPANAPALHTACEFGHLAPVALLLKAGVPFNSRKETRTILHTACFARRIPVVQLLLCLEEGKALLNERDINGLTALHLAVSSDSASEQEQCPCCTKGAHRVDNHLVVKLLISAGANVNESSNDGVTPLHIACEKKNSAVVKSLIDAHAQLDSDATMIGFNGVTPLHVACFYGNRQAVVYLLEAGANIDLETENGFTPKRVAEEKEYHEISALIQEKEAQLKAHP